MEFSRQEYWNGLPFSSPGDLPNPGIEPESPALQADSLPQSHLGIWNRSHLIIGCPRWVQYTLKFEKQLYKTCYSAFRQKESNPFLLWRAVDSGRNCDFKLVAVMFSLNYYYVSVMLFSQFYCHCISEWLWTLYLFIHLIEKSPEKQS